MAALANLPDRYDTRTAATDLAIFQYTSGTTREIAAAIRHTHRALVVVMNAALYGTGLRPGDRFFCPSSPAWGHGLWHGTLAPLALGIETGAYAGKFSAERLLKALQDYRSTNLSAAATHYRMIKNTGRTGDYRTTLQKLSFTGEPIDHDTLVFTQSAFGAPLCSMYGTTEVGVILANYPGAEDFVIKEGSLGRPVPGVDVEVQRPDGSRCAPGEVGEIKIRRHDAWFPTKDRGRVDADGYFYHAGRADDVIISAGWTMSAVEIEDALLKHPAVQAAAVIGVPDPLRGLVVKAFVVPAPGHATDAAVAADIQTFVRSRLSQHEYPTYRRLRPRPAANAGREDQSQGPARSGSRRNVQRRPANGDSMNAEPTRLFAKITDEALDALCAPARTFGSRTRSNPGAMRRRATTSVITRTASATTTRCGAIRAMRRGRDSAMSLRCRVSCSPPAESSPAMSAAFPACMRCGPAPTGPGTSRCCAIRRSRPRPG